MRISKLKEDYRKAFPGVIAKGERWILRVKKRAMTITILHTQFPRFIALVRNGQVSRVRMIDDGSRFSARYIDSLVKKALGDIMLKGSEREFNIIMNGRKENFDEVKKALDERIRRSNEKGCQGA